MNPHGEHPHLPCQIGVTDLGIDHPQHSLLHVLVLHPFLNLSRQLVKPVHQLIGVSGGVDDVLFPLVVDGSGDCPGSFPDLLRVTIDLLNFFTRGFDAIAFAHKSEQGEFRLYRSFHFKTCK